MTTPVDPAAPAVPVAASTRPPAALPAAPPPSSPAAPPTPPAAPRRRWWPWLLGGTLALLLALVAGGWLFWKSDAGLRWALGQVPGLTVEGLRGRPDGGTFGADRLEWRSGDQRVTVEDLRWGDLQWSLRPYPGAWVRVEIKDPRAARIDVDTGKPKDRPQPPPDLKLPLELVVTNLQVDALQVNDLPPVEALGADLHLGAERGERHRVGRVTARVEGLGVDGRLEIASGGEMALAGAVKVASKADAPLPWSADVTLGGKLVEPVVGAQLAAASGAGATVEATLRPFAAWPLAALQAATKDLDLATLAPGLPTTRLSGRAVVDSSARDAPVRAQLDFTNALPGRWDAGRLPLRRVEATVQGRLDDLRTVELPALTLQLADAADPAGRVTGSGRWQGNRLTLDLDVAELRPSRLDRRAAPMVLAGPLKLAVDGLPSPRPDAPAAGGAAGAPPAAGGVAGAPPAAGGVAGGPPPAGGTGSTAPALPLVARVETDLRGTLLQPRRVPVRAAAKAELSMPVDGTLAVAVEALELAAGEARAKLDATVARDAQRQWRARTQGEFSQFDPAAWWPGDAPAVLARGPSRLNGRWQADLSLPDAALSATAPAATAKRPAAATARVPVPALAQALRGTARVDLQPSRLGGVPLEGEAALAATDALGQLDATLRLGANRASLQWRRPARTAEPERWRVDVDAPALAALKPLADLVPAAAPWLPTTGTVRVQAQGEGLWPRLRTSGELQLRDTRAPGWQAGSVDARWTAATGRLDAPLALTLAARDLARGEQRIDRLDAQLDGSLGAHRLTLDAASPVRLPAWTDAAPGDPGAADGTVLRVQADGRWQPDGGVVTATAGTWSGRIAELRAAPRRSGAAPWALARDVAVALRVDPDRGGVVSARAEPGSATVLGATLRWTQAQYAAAPATPAGAPPSIDLVARLEPMAVVPWLQRLQPELGWGGDLRVRADIEVHRARTLAADIVLERVDGDLALRVGDTPRAAGLTQARVALVARDREWRVTEAVVGTALGELTGAQTLRLAASETLLPGPLTALAGQLRLRANELATFNPLLPAGWRVAGRLQADATLAGTLGEPVIDGRVTGSGLEVKNLFEGVDVRDGTLAATVTGRQATIERLVFRDAAQGELSATGTVSFGAAPGAALTVRAARFRVLDRLDRRVVASGQADIRLADQKLGVTGGFTVDEGLIDLAEADTPTLDQDVIVVNRRVDLAAAAARRAGGETPKPPTSPFKDTDVQLTLDMGDQLRVRGRGIDTLVKGRLRVTTPGGKLAVNGTLRTEAGTFAAYGQNLTIERGIVDFAGDPTAPRLDILAVRSDLDTRVGVTVQGSALTPRIRLYSDPDLSDIDKLSYLVLGREPSTVGGGDAALLQRAALALAAGEGGGGSNSVLKKLGLDELSISGIGSGDLSQAVVTVGKQLSKNLFIGYEQGLNSAGGAWQLVYRVARQFTVRARAGTESSIDAVYTWRWDGRPARAAPDRPR